MDGTTVFFVVFLLIIGSVIAFQVVTNSRQRAQDATDGVTTRLKVAGIADLPLRITRTELIEGYREGAPRHSLAGLTARVEDSGTLNRRITATRMVALGVFALAAPKRQDDREVYLTIEGPTTAIVRAIKVKSNPTIGVTARKFAMDLNAASRVAGAQDKLSSPDASIGDLEARE